MSAEGVRVLKQEIIRDLKVAVALGTIDPVEALSVVMAVAAHIVASVDHADRRAEIAKTVSEGFAEIVEFARECGEREVDEQSSSAMQ